MIRPFPYVSQRRVAAFGLVALLALAGCKAKTIDYYRANPIERNTMVNKCLANNYRSRDCANAINAEAERWGTKDIDGFTVGISGDGGIGDPAASQPQPGAPPTGPATPDPKAK